MSSFLEGLETIGQKQKPRKSLAFYKINIRGNTAAILGSAGANSVSVSLY